MASLIGKPVGKVAQEVADLEQGRVFQSPLNKAWRALILLNRTTSPMAKSGVRETNTEAKKLMPLILTMPERSLFQWPNPKILGVITK